MQEHITCFDKNVMAWKEQEGSIIQAVQVSTR